MKSSEVIKILRISRPTIYKYRVQGKLHATKLPNGHYNYDESSVYSLLHKDVRRKNYVYARVSTPKQKKDLQRQIELLKTWCFQTWFPIDGIYADIASCSSFEKRKECFQLLDEITFFNFFSFFFIFNQKRNI